MHSTDDLNHLQLGQTTAYPTAFDPGLLMAVPVHVIVNRSA